MRPDSFDDELQEDWSRWVIEHGLPDMPESELAADQSVPVAYWVGPRTAAVAHIMRGREELQDEPETYAAWFFFYRVDGTWMSAGNGAMQWRQVAPLARVDLPPDHVDLRPSTGAGCLALSGEVGSAAAVIEAVQAEEVSRRPIEAPTGLIVVCGDSTKPFTVRILGADGMVLAEIDAHVAWRAAWEDVWFRVPRDYEMHGPPLPPPPVPPRPGQGTVFINGHGNRWSASWQDEHREWSSPEGPWERVATWARQQPAKRRLVFSAEANKNVDLDTLNAPPRNE